MSNGFKHLLELPFDLKEKKYFALYTQVIANANLCFHSVCSAYHVPKYYLSKKGTSFANISQESCLGNFAATFI